MNIIEDVWGLIKFKLKEKVFEDTEEMWKEIKNIEKAFLDNKSETYRKTQNIGQNFQKFRTSTFFQIV